MNAVMERWVLTCRRELLDRTLIWNQRHLLHALREFEQFYNCHRPHQGIANARPLQALPEPPSPTDIDACFHMHRHDRLWASSTNTGMSPPYQHGCNFRQAQGQVHRRHRSYGDAEASVLPRCLSPLQAGGYGPCLPLERAPARLLPHGGKPTSWLW